MNAVRPLYLPAPYQDSALEGRLILRDGSTATVRLSCRDDANALAQFFRHLSPESRRMRFFSETKPGLDVIQSLCGDNDPRKQMTLVVTRIADRSTCIVATGSYMAHSEKTAEFAVAVDDAFQGKGMGGLILERLSILAASHGFVHFIAVTDASNRLMLDVFRHSGFESREAYQEGYVQVDMSITQQARSVAYSELRDRLFTKASMLALFNPQAVVVFTSSADPNGPGYRVVLGMTKGGFKGQFHVVSPDARQIGPQPAFTRLKELPGPVELAILAVPAEIAVYVVDECAECGVRAVLILSGGFADADARGAQLQQKLLEKIRGYGMRLIGPNSCGVINTDDEVRLNASLAKDLPRAGRIALSSQSGAVGMALIDLARRRGLGLARFISMGNKADVTGNDLLQTWEDDASVAVILLYLESFGNPRRFARIARRVSAGKPIVCVKAGRAGASGPDRDVFASVLRSSDTVVRALFRQTGVIRADTLEEMFDVAALLESQPLPAGRRVGFVTNSHGAAVLCADAARAGRLEVVEPEDHTATELEEMLPATAHARPMVDLSASAQPSHYRTAVEHVMLDRATDAVIVVYAPVSPAPHEAYLQAIREGVAAARNLGVRDKPVAVVMMTEDGPAASVETLDEKLPCYLFPENAARALSAAADYAAWRRLPPGHLVDFEGVRAQEARDLCEAALAQSGESWLQPDDTALVLKAFGLPMFDVPGAAPIGKAVAEIVVGVTDDPLFGPLIGFGLAGLPTECMQDMCFCVTPLTDRDARDMIKEVRARHVLEGDGIRPAGDVEAVIELLLRVSLLIEEVPEIRAIELSPVAVFAPGTGCFVLRARIRVAPANVLRPSRSAIAATGLPQPRAL